MIYLRIDQVMLGEMVGSEEVGIYSAAVRLAEVWYFIPTAIYSSVYPSIVEARSISDELFYGRLQKLYNFMAFLAYAVAIPVTFMAGWAVELLFGHAYGRAGSMLAVLIWAGMFTNLGVARSTFLMSMNWTKVHFMTVFMGAIVNVLLNYILIPRYGGMGAVIASCVAYWVAAHGSCYLYKPLFRTGNMLTKAILYPKVW
jgi:O-antigen/teichoic acid export membrane protein